MLRVEDYEAIRRAYFVEKQSIRAIATAQHHAPKTIRKALGDAAPKPYTLKVPRAAPRLGAFKAQIDELLAANERLPRKQRYTAHKIFQTLQAAGYVGSEATVRGYVAQQRRSTHRPPVYLPLEFDPGQDAQVDWGEATVCLGGETVTVQLFVMRLCYSRKVFVRAYPTQKQESFFEGHVRAFEYLGGVPQTLTYDNLATAVQRVLEGRTREEQRAFVAFRSHYLFASRFCTPGEGHEKGGVEHGVGYVRRNFLVPPPEVPDFAALNVLLQSACEADDQRQVHRQPEPISAMWVVEQPHLRPLPTQPFACCDTVAVTLNPYGQVVYETNRYSVPAEQVRRHLVLKAYPFHIEISDGTTHLARHPRCYGREQDIYDPLHYLPLLAQRPGAFEHAKPLREWRATWPPIYEQVLQWLRTHTGTTEGHIIREFVQILSLHRDHPAVLIEQALTQALAYGCPHVAGVRLCLHQLQQPAQPVPVFNWADQPHLANLQTIGQQPLDLQRYDQLLRGD